MNAKRKDVIVNANCTVNICFLMCVCVDASLLLIGFQDKNANVNVKSIQKSMAQHICIQSLLYSCATDCVSQTISYFFLIL